MREEAPSLRLDRWLWFARFFKTRGLATAACAAGRVRLEGTGPARPHAAVRPGQVLTFVQGRHVRVVRVVALGIRRGPAPEAQALYEDLAPPDLAAALPEPAPGRVGRGRRRQARGAGGPGERGG
jgi:ribosome-associated heat shock protein Hsp15